MKETEFEKFKADVEAFHNRYVASGGKLTTYTCQHCGNEIQTIIPKTSFIGSKGYTDSAKGCTECGKVNFVLTWPNGLTEVVKEATQLLN